MKTYEIKGAPIPWMRSGRVGNKYYDRQMSEKKRYQWEIKAAMCGLFAHTSPIKVRMEFHMPIPKSWASIKKTKWVGQPHNSRPDVDNLIKFVNDSLNNILWVDDSIIFEIHTIKLYSKEPLTRIFIETYKGEELIGII